MNDLKVCWWSIDKPIPYPQLESVFFWYPIDLQRSTQNYERWPWWTPKPLREPR